LEENKLLVGWELQYFSPNLWVSQQIHFLYFFISGVMFYMTFPPHLLLVLDTRQVYNVYE
jgi:hypothetical protein